MTDPKMMQKVKVVSGMYPGIVGRIIQIDHTWPAPYAIRIGRSKLWFYADDLEPVTANCGFMLTTWSRSQQMS